MPLLRRLLHLSMHDSPLFKPSSQPLIRYTFLSLTGVAVYCYTTAADTSRPTTSHVGPDFFSLPRYFFLPSSPSHLSTPSICSSALSPRSSFAPALLLFQLAYDSLLVHMECMTAFPIG